LDCLLGIDDTDSTQGYCTTYLAYRIATELRTVLTVKAYPRLVRLNPNVPFKTRGNAAVCLPLSSDQPEAAFDAVCALVSELSDLKHGANPGVVFWIGRPADFFRDLYERAVCGMVNRAPVLKTLAELGAKTFTLGNGMGVVGAAASLGFDESKDHTYELISYRKPERWGTPRQLDASSVLLMDASTFPDTFNNYDYQKKKILITPAGPDPVFAGIRGETPASVIRAFSELRGKEPLSGYMVYVTNQLTDAHLTDETDWKAYSAGWVQGEILGTRVGPGGHLYLDLKTNDARRSAAVYEPTGDLRREAKRLRPGDSVRIGGGVRRRSQNHPAILNAEKIEVISAVGPGRNILPGIYASSPRANRHLAKPLARHGREQVGVVQPEVKGWLRRWVTP